MTFYVCLLLLVIPITETDSRKKKKTGVTTDFAIWTTLEVGIGIVASCAATLRPLLQAIVGKSSQGTSSNHQRPRLGAFWRNPLSRVNPEHGKYQRHLSPDINIPLYNPPNKAKTSVIAVAEARDNNTPNDEEESSSHGASNAGIVRTVSISVAEVRAARLQPRNHTREVTPWPRQLKRGRDC